MQPANLLIVDGDSLRTPDLSTVMAQEGWRVAWAGGAEAAAAAGTLPDLVLFDPDRITEGGIELLRALRARRTDLPLVALGGAEGDEAWARKARLESRCLHRMAREVSLQSWPATLRSCLGGFGPGAQKFTTEDLFGDILADMEGPAAAQDKAGAEPVLPPEPSIPVPSRSAVPPPAAPSPAVPHPAAPSLAVPHPAAPSPAAPRPAAVPPPPVRSAPVLTPFVPPSGPTKPTPVTPPQVPAAGPRPLPVPPPAPLPPTAGPRPVPPAGKEYTLSGISGVSDPFHPAETAIRATGPLPPIQESWAAPSARPAPEPPPPDPSMEEFGNYYLLEKVAVGGMAELFKARQRGVHDFEKIVAIKRILPHLSDNDEFVRMFIDEAKLAAQLTHPNIVQIFDLGKAMGFYYIAMEFVDGRDLRSLLRKVREYRLPVPEPIAASVTMKVASALDYAHRKRGINDKELRLVHRDISPQNILISYEGAVKLVDFGIAKAATKSTQTMAGALKGKLLYMSPEQALGQHLDGRSDIYSLGLVLFELLTGERCFQADSELGVLEKVRMGKVQDVRGVNPAVSSEMAAIVGKALNKDVDHRYVSARFLERDLKNLLVRTHSEPTEHDVAEYVNTVLKGSRTDLEALLAHRYPEPATAQAANAGQPAAPQAAPKPQPAPKPPEPLPLPPMTPSLEPMETSRSPIWLIPVVLGIIAAVAWVAMKMFK